MPKKKTTTKKATPKKTTPFTILKHTTLHSLKYYVLLCLFVKLIHKNKMIFFIL
jgi:hypothetical protein